MIDGGVASNVAAAAPCIIVEGLGVFNVQRRPSFRLVSGSIGADGVVI